MTKSIGGLPWRPFLKRRTSPNCPGKTFGAEEIVRKARQFFGLDESVPVRVVENGEGTDYQTFSVTAETKQGRLQMDYTKKGGHLIWYMNNRQTGPRQLSANQAVQKAKTFLKKHGFGEMEPVNYNEYENVAHVTLARVKDNVLVYPQKLAVKVALDRGDAVGLQASDYILSQGERKWEKPQMTAAEAKKRLNPDFEVQGQRLAVIENDLKKEVLCYQFSGRINGSLYRIYLNADTGLEEKVEQVRQSHLGA